MNESEINITAEESLLIGEALRKLLDSTDVDKKKNALQNLILKFIRENEKFEQMEEYHNCIENGTPPNWRNEIPF